MKIILNIILVTLLVVANALAVPSIVESNDFFSSYIKPEDSNYTQGLELASTRPYADAPQILKTAASYLPEFCIGITCAVPGPPDFIGFGIAQDIFTPRSRDIVELLPDEDPYAGYLYSRLTRLNQSEHYRISTSLYLGMIGPWSFAEYTQNWFHDLIHNKRFKGWDNQLHNELAGYLNYKRGFIDYKKEDYSWVMLLTDTEINVGTVYTDLSFRKEIRLGYNIQGYNLTNKNFSIYIYAHPEVKGILRNIFLDGNTFRKSAHVDTEHFQASIESGLTVEYYGWSISYYTDWSTKDYSQQTDKIHGYAGIRIEKFFDMDDL